VLRLCPESAGETTTKVWGLCAELELSTLRQSNSKKQYNARLDHELERWQLRIKPPILNQLNGPSIIPMPIHLNQNEPSIRVPSSFSVEGMKLYWKKHNELKIKYAKRMIQLLHVFNKLQAQKTAEANKQERLHSVVKRLHRALKILTNQDLDVHSSCNIQTLYQLEKQIEKTFVPILKKVEAKKRSAESTSQSEPQLKRPRASPTSEHTSPKLGSREALLTPTSLSPLNEPSQTPDELAVRPFETAKVNAYTELETATVSI